MTEKCATIECNNPSWGRSIYCQECARNQNTSRSKFREDGLCACPGCENPHRERSKYCSDKCNQKAARIKMRDYDRAYQEAHRRPARANYPAMRKVIVFDPMCGSPYTIPLSEYRMYAGKYLPGTRIIMDGQEMVIT
jgi:hypothetical protein